LQIRDLRGTQPRRHASSIIAPSRAPWQLFFATRTKLRDFVAGEGA
jgi:hypothetical protein